MNCFGGVNLRNKKYVFLGAQLTKKEYENRISSINLGDYLILEDYRKKFLELKKGAIHPALENKNVVNSVGAFIENCKDCYYTYYLYECERCAYTVGCLAYKDSYDVFGGTHGEKCYELFTISTQNNFNVKFSHQIDESRDIEYCELMRNCHNCFGCLGLHNKSFCVFNKQYSEKDYWELVDLIKFKMLTDGEYGEFFSPKYSLIPYNISTAAYLRGFDDINVAAKFGYIVEDVRPKSAEVKELINSSQLPNDIKDVGDSILEKIIFDKDNDKKFQITPYELSFYRKYNLPLPRIHPFHRMKKRSDYWYIRMNFFEAICANCGRKMVSYFNPGGAEKVYCLECYRKIMS
jgi:CxxC-x17-CxxC domain-containing protein